MHLLLRFAGIWNIICGAFMMFGFPKIYSMIDLETPQLTLPIQIVGMMVLLFGVGYILVDRNPLANRNVLLMGMISKLCGPVLAISYIVSGVLPLLTIPLLILADLIYLYPFWLILRQIDAQ